MRRLGRRSRIRWSVRVRTAVAAVAVIAPVLAVAGVVGVEVQRRELTSGVAQLAEQQAGELAHEGSEEPLSSIDSEVLLQVVDLGTGAVRSSSGGAGDRALVAAPPADGSSTTVVDGTEVGESDRFVVVAVRTDDGAAYVVVGRSLESVDAASASTTRIVVVGGLLVLVTVWVLSLVATGRALLPVERMRVHAALLSADELDERLPVPDTDDELARLAETLNAMLARLDDDARHRRRFVADASHELRSPVATIATLVESDRISPHPGGRAGLAGEVLAETARMARLVDDLLALARGDSATPPARHPVDLSTLLHAEGGRRRRVPVSVDVPGGLLVDGDADGLTRAVRNLLDNAERYAADAVSLAAWAEGDDVDDMVVVEVLDDGPGIAEADRDRVFERFVRLDEGRSRSDGGAGLGLAIVQQVVTDHGGTVEIGSVAAAAPAGTRVVVRLPRSGG